IVDVDVLFADQVQQQVERTVVHLAHGDGEGELAFLARGANRRCRGGAREVWKFRHEDYSTPIHNPIGRFSQRDFPAGVLCHLKDPIASTSPGRAFFMLSYPLATSLGESRFSPKHFERGPEGPLFHLQTAITESILEERP